MITSGNQNQFPSSFSPFGDLLKVLIFLSNLNGFNSFPSPPVQGFARRKGSSKVWKEMAPSDSVTSSLSFCFCLHYLCVLLYCFESV